LVQKLSNQLAGTTTATSTDGAIGCNIGNTRNNTSYLVATQHQQNQGSDKNSNIKQWGPAKMETINRRWEQEQQKQQHQSGNKKCNRDKSSTVKG